ncbi:M1 family metallopeptidase [Pedobacter sp. HDW13]|uniref:M1 family metallopeptidase n=1 Tax=unclassified Pedobacter TaxID=2628915 RepID=UPI000F5A2C64|nr:MULTISPECIES: M1 family metallopeptidase [unclassified Pedobacter]QIL41762.1 M1 family metallopeptidase [Pedobacter sp. HDW13]RQO73458.1 peptidase [Pedobacter sp. KBW01]
MKCIKLLGFLLCSAICANAQTQLPIEPVFQQSYQKETRSTSGKPGKHYWQNSSKYDIQVDFNPVSRLLKGKIQVVYTNNSRDTLKEIWFKLYPNLYKKGTSRKAKFSESDLGEGVTIDKLAANGKTITGFKIDGTNMTVDVPAVLPGKTISFSVDYNYTLNKGSHMRTGQVDEGSHFVAYFFPRIAVYDDVDGWNKFPYTGAEEFYNDFDQFNAAITVPGGYGVWATGDLKNPNEVFQKDIVARMLSAEKNDAVIDVITDKDLADKKVTQPNTFNTFKFEAKNVTDFVFALSDHYLWKSSSLVVDPKTKRRTRVDAVFNPKHKDYYEVIDFARKTVESMSYTFPKWPFPYNHETIFDGLDQMEYPMMVNDNPVDNRTDAITLTDHEIFHTMFPFYMGINETKYGWMDEGWATIGEWLISPMIDSTIVDEYGVQPTASTSGGKDDSPIMTLTPDLKGSGTFTNSYPKPGLAYLFVKDYLGDELFIKALHTYIRNWNGKHPMPYDFFNSMNEGSGKNLNWFWKAWFFESGVTDMAIKAVNKNSNGYTVTIENKSIKPLPIDLTLTYADGTTEKHHNTIGVWEKGDQQVKIEIKTAKKLSKVVMGSAHVPDKVKSDNSFSVN